MANVNFPTRFIERIKQVLVEKKNQSEFFDRCTAPLPKTVRVVHPKKNLDTLPKDWTLTPVADIPSVYFIERPNQKELALGKTFEHRTGKIYSATLSSLFSAFVLDAQPEEKVLDLCAAPGSKSTFLAEKIGKEGILVANELSASRIKKLAANMDRLAIANTVLTQNNGATMHFFLDQEFDRILVDAPCSSEGFGRKSSAFFEKQWFEHKIHDCAKLQRQLIVSAFRMLAPGGTMVYSTCTTAPEENELVVQHLLEEFGDAVELQSIPITEIPHTNGITEFNGTKILAEVQQKSVRLWPHLYSDKWDSECFFIVKIKKTEATQRPPAVKEFSDSLLKKMPKNKMAELIVRWHKSFGIPRDEFKRLILANKNGEVFLTNSGALSFAKKNKYQRVGLKLLDAHGNITPEFVQRFGVLITKNRVELTKEQVQKYLDGYDLMLEPSQLDELNVDSQFQNAVVVKYDGFALGWGKLLKGGKLKNKIDRGLL
ncbi:hypothetical protein CSB37_02345 [bacterium DOLZORAL124_38_8]|nr:MAG: hypothetical protein CSB37_02345 [bacterium DOLZORAL124_38_8]